MKRIIILATIVASMALTQSCYKREYHTFLNNKSGEEVTVSYEYNQQPRSYTLKSGERLEIPDIEKWSLTHNQTTSIVYFQYGDTTIVHSCEQMIYDDGTGKYVYTPAENNILCADLGNSSWITSDPHHHNDVDEDYFIER